MAHSFNPPDVWKPFGAFSHAVIAGSGRCVSLKGQVALDKDGQIVGEGSMELQVRQVLHNISDVLAALGGRMSDIVSLNQFTTDIEAFMRCGAIRQEAFKAPFPVTTTLQVVSLYDPLLLVEINGTAEIPKERFVMPNGAEVMHGC